MIRSLFLSLFFVALIGSGPAADATTCQIFWDAIDDGIGQGIQIPAAYRRQFPKWVSDQMIERVALEQISNTPHFRIASLTPKMSRPVAVYSFWVSETETWKFQQNTPDAKTPETRVKDGEVQYRFLVPEYDGVPIEELRSHYRLTQTNLIAFRMQSHATFLVLDPSGRRAPQFIKATREAHDKFMNRTELNNGHQNARVAVSASELVAKTLKDGNETLIDVLQEPWGLAVRTTRLEYESIYAFSVRDFHPARGPPDAESVLYPVNGFFGTHNWKSAKYPPGVEHVKTDLVNQAARARGYKTTKAWMNNEFLPKYAEMLATLHFKYGLYPVVHTQNLLIDINRRTGVINRFVIRDMNDVVVDHYARSWHGLPHHHTLTEAGIFRLNVESPTSSDNRVDFAWTYDHSHPVRVMSDLYKDNVWHGKFLKIYSETAARHADIPVGRVDLARVSSSEMGLLYGMERIAESIYRAKTSQLYKASMQNYKQTVLKEIVDRHHEKDHIAYIVPDIREVVDQIEDRWDSRRKYYFAFDGKGIFILTSAKKPVAYVFGLTGAEIARANAAKIRRRRGR